MIGYYIHHRGRGHLHRAQALAAALEEPVTGLSSLPRPAGWHGPWIDLPRDDDPPVTGDVTANQQLHWVPLAHPGLRARTAAISAWIDQNHPRLLVVDVSVEVALLGKLHGTPVISVVLPGRRTDPAHLLGFRASDRLAAMWPPHVHGMTPGLPADITARISCLGAVSRLPVVSDDRPRGRRRERHVVVLQGRGGTTLTRRTSRDLGRSTPGWSWTVLGAAGAWTEDVQPVLASADVVITQAGQNSLADVAACRKPAIVVPAPRPFDEQVTTANVLAGDEWPALVLREFPDTGWSERLEAAAAQDGSQWQMWCDGLAARRFAGLVAQDLSADEQRTA